MYYLLTDEDLVNRDIEEVLEPGIHALLDICQPSDLQLIHTVLEGQST